MSDIIIGSFSMQRCIGRGGMSEVWRGEHLQTGQAVAIKVMTASQARQAQHREAFRLEIQALARLNHPHIASVLDVGHLPTDVDRLLAGSPYLVMEFVPGRTLDYCLDQLDWSGLKRVLLALLDALAHAHAMGLVHRDIKPHNVILSPPTPGAALRIEDALIELVDFGIARRLDRSDLQNTSERESRVQGTPPYMAPEQIAGFWREQGPWTDLYAMGCLAWYLCCGEPPFTGSRDEVLRAHIAESPPLFRPNFEVPAGLEGWLRRLLAKYPDDRFERAADAATALLELQSTPEEGIERGQLPVLDALLGNLDRKQDRRWMPAPFVRDWREVMSPARSMQLTGGAGLGLFGMRQIPLVDRHAEREVLWRALDESTSQREPRMVVVRGPRGCGKSRLSQWLTHRAHEIGAATVMHTDHNPRSGPLDGIGPMLLRHFQLIGLPRQRIIERVEILLEDLHVESHRVSSMAVALTELMSPRPVNEISMTPSAQFSSPMERHRLLVRLLVQMGQRRGLIMVLDDAHWSLDTLSFAHFVAMTGKRLGELPLLLVLCVSDEQLEEMPDEAALLESFSRTPHTRDITMQPLEESDHRALVEELLGLDPVVTERVIDRTLGSPLFAVQLVDDLVSREALEPGPTGLRLSDPEGLRLPEDISELCAARIDGVLHKLGGTSQKERGELVLELAAALGEDVSHVEWHHLCRHVGIEVPADLLDLLVRRRLVTVSNMGWRFAYGALHDTVVERARQHGRWQDHHAACARVLLELYHRQQLGVASRYADHMLEAGEPGRAIEPLLLSVNQALDGGDYKEARHAQRRLERVIEQLDLPGDAPRRLEAHCAGAAIAAKLGQIEEARARVDAIFTHQDLATRAPLALGWARMLQGVFYRLRGEHEASREAFASSIEAFEATHDTMHAGDEMWLSAAHLRVKVMGNLGLALMSIGRREDALEVFERCRKSALEEGQLQTAAHAQLHVGYMRSALGHAQQGLEEVYEALELAQEAGNRRIEAHCCMALAYTLRYEGDTSTSMDYCQRALALFEEIGDEHGASSARLNLAISALAQGDIERATQLFEDLLATMESMGRMFMLPYALLGLSCCHAQKGDLQRAARELGRVESQLHDDPMVDRDLAWLAEILSHAAEEDHALVARALELAVSQWRASSEPVRAERAQARLDALNV